jgi:hypothetical protein
LFRSLETLDGLILTAHYTYFANEWFLNAGAIRSGLRAVWRGGDLPTDEAETSGREGRALALRYGPWVAVLRRIRAQGMYHLAIGSRATGPVRDRRVAGHYVDETVDRGLSRRSRGIALLGASHAGEAAFYGRQQTTRQILEGFGWTFTSARIFEGGSRQSEGFSSDPDRGFVKPLGGGSSFSLPALLPDGVQQLAVRTRRRLQGKRSPFYSVCDNESTSGRSIAQQFEIVVLARDS